MTVLFRFDFFEHCSDVISFSAQKFASNSKFEMIEKEKKMFFTKIFFYFVEKSIGSNSYCNVHKCLSSNRIRLVEQRDDLTKRRKSLKMKIVSFCCFFFVFFKFMFRFYVNCQRWKPSQDQWIFAFRCLAEHERHYVDQMKYKRDAKNSLIGQILIRYLLSEAFQKKSSSFEIHRTQTNRPWFDSNRLFDFNLSHRECLVAIAASFDGRVGCDTMIYSSKTSRTNYKRVARKVLTVDELNYLENQSKDEFDRIRCFHRFWSLKESYVKWLGQGLTFPLLKLNFQIQTNSFETRPIISDTKLRIDGRLTTNEVRFDEQLIDLDLEQNEQQLITVCSSTFVECRPFVELNIDAIFEKLSPFDDDRNDLSFWWRRFQEKIDEH